MYLLELLKSTNINGNFFAVELNKEVIPKSLYSSKEIKEGDKIEIVHFIGGG